MGAVVIFIGPVLGIVFVCLSVLEKRSDNLIMIPVWLITCILSVAFGVCLERDNTVTAADYLKSPDSYQVDTFMVNGILDHYKVSNK